MKREKHKMVGMGRPLYRKWLENTLNTRDQKENDRRGADLAR